MKNRKKKKEKKNFENISAWKNLVLRCSENSRKKFKCQILSYLWNFSDISELEISNKRCQHCIQLREYWQVPLSNNTWVVSKQMGTIYAVPIHASRYILSNLDFVHTRIMCACMCMCLWIHFIWGLYVTKYEEVNGFKI